MIQLADMYSGRCTRLASRDTAVRRLPGLDNNSLSAATHISKCPHYPPQVTIKVQLLLVHALL
jgi:hypothetical protein